MANSTPDLIQRAAARLEKAHASTIGRVPVQGIPADRSFPQSSERTEAASVASADGRRLSTISPVNLARNGIKLPEDGYSRTVEEFRAIKRHVLAGAARARTNSNSMDRVLLVTSARPGDGKTFAAINLAFALAYEKDTRVLLIDADAYRHSVLESLGISAGSGWLDIVSSATSTHTDHILRTNVANLAVLPAGEQRPGIPELMSSRRMKNLLDELGREDPGRLIIIDALPCLTSTEPPILAGLAGQTLFVVAAHQTSRYEIEASLRLLNMSPRVSLILNKAEPLLAEHFESYEYGYGPSQ